MGTCASVPKAMRDEDGGAPPPEPPKEEATAEVAEVKSGNKEVAVEGGEKAAEGGGDNAMAEDEKNHDGDRQSLGTLLETEEAKESSKIEKTSEPSQKIEKIFEQEIITEEISVSDKVARVPPTESPEKAAYVAPVARATEDEKET
ncbi:hypothetical protein U1Q18_045582 [Sarracenia purpurea var. burkii]